MCTDAVGGEEVAASLAPAWHAKGFTGKGVKVAIIDGGFVGLAERQAAGDLPASAVTQDICGGRFNTRQSTERPSPRSSTRLRRRPSCI